MDFEAGVGPAARPLGPTPAIVSGNNSRSAFHLLLGPTVTASLNSAACTAHSHLVRLRGTPASAARYAKAQPRGAATLSTILLVLLIVLLVGAFSGRRRWGHAPGGIVGVLLIIVLVLLLTGHR